MSTSDVRKLTRMQEEIDNARTNRDILLGSIEEIKKRLKENGVRSIADGKKILERKRKRLEVLKRQLSEGVEALEI